ncbi:hypothetical protein [Sideroxydans sp. CL21]|nr:hypothetical protein [Sideroxydans sp. CL21]
MCFRKVKQCAWNSPPARGIQHGYAAIMHLRPKASVLQRTFKVK